MSKITDKLRRKFKTPQAALAALGLDARDIGADIIVGDSRGGLAARNKRSSDMSGKSIVLTRKAAMLMGACHAFLQNGPNGKPRLAADAKIDWGRILGRVTSKNLSQMKGAIVAGLREQTRGKLAKDASIDGIVDLINAVERVEGEPAEDMETDPSSAIPMKEDDETADEDPRANLKDYLKGKGVGDADMDKACDAVDAAVGSMERAEEGEDENEPEDEDEIARRASASDRRRAKDEPPPFKGRPEVGGGMSKDAVNRVVKDALRQANDETNKKVAAAVMVEREKMQAVRDAERFVRPWVGDMAMAHDSAEAVYETALGALGQDIKEVPPSVGAYKAILSHIPLPGKKNASADHVELAADSATSASFREMFPGVARIKRA